MNVRKSNLNRPVVMGGWLTDMGNYLGKASRSAADIWARATSPTIVTTETEDKTPLYLGLAGVGLIGVLLITKSKKRRR